MKEETKKEKKKIIEISASSFQHRCVKHPIIVLPIVIV